MLEEFPRERERQREISSSFDAVRFVGDRIGALGGWQGERQIDTQRSVKRRKTKHTHTHTHTLVEGPASNRVSLVFDAPNIPLGTLVECVRQGGEAVKSIQCFVLSDVKRIGRDKTHARGVNQPPPPFIPRSSNRSWRNFFFFFFLIRFFLLIDELLSFHGTYVRKDFNRFSPRRSAVQFPSPTRNFNKVPPSG